MPRDRPRHPRYAEVADRAEHACEYCLAPEELSGKEFEVEHILPRIEGGTDHPDNLALADARRAPSDARFGVDPATGQQVPLFNPRVDDWDTCFDFVALAERARIEILGRNAIGRATVERLHMNAPHAARARWHWFQYYRLAAGEEPRGPEAPGSLS